MRKALGWNQEDLASRLGVDQSTVSDIERGAGFSADLLMRMAESLGGTAALIMQGKDDAVWPFHQVSIERFLALNIEQRAFVEGALATAIALVESPNTEDIRRFETAHVRPVKPKQKKRAA